MNVYSCSCFPYDTGVKETLSTGQRCIDMAKCNQTYTQNVRILCTIHITHSYSYVRFHCIETKLKIILHILELVCICGVDVVH